MTKFTKTLIAAAVALSAGNANAVLFGTGLNDIEIVNRENNYRLSSNCTFEGTPEAPPTCLLDGSIGDGKYSLVNPELADNVKVGDLFIGVVASRDITKVGDVFSTWGQDNTPPGVDTFSGYFVQEVKEIQPNVNPAGDERLILGTFGGADPFGILSAGESARLFVDNATFGPQTPYGLDSGTVASVIASMTDGTLWASLTVGNTVLGTAVDNDGYIFSLLDTDTAGSSGAFAGTFFTAFNIGVTGPAYNVDALFGINDPIETKKGGELIGDPGLTTALNLLGLCNPVANVYACNGMVGNGQLGFNQSWAGGNSPWVFASEDPYQLYNGPSVPEPGTLALLGLGLAGLATLRRRAT